MVLGINMCCHGEYDDVYPGIVCEVVEVWCLGD